MSQFSERLRRAQDAADEADQERNERAVQEEEALREAVRKLQETQAKRLRIAERLAGALVAAEVPFDRGLEIMGDRTVPDFGLFGREKGSHVERGVVARHNVWELRCQADAVRQTDEHGWIAEYGQDYRVTALTSGGLVCKAMVQIPRRSTELYGPTPPIPRRLEIGARPIDTFQICQPEDLDGHVEDGLLSLATRHRVDPAVFAKEDL